MGKTESCFPGIWNAGAGELELAVSACVVPVGSLDVDVPDPSLGFPPEFAPGVGDDPEAEEELAESAAAEAVESEPEADEAEDAEDADEEAAEAAADEDAAMAAMFKASNENWQETQEKMAQCVVARLSLASL